MSADALASLASMPPGVPGETPSASLDWFLNLLQEAMTAVMAGEAPPIQKANAIARLGNLYLKTCRLQELERAHKDLAARLAELEQRLAQTEDQSRAPEADANRHAEHREGTHPSVPASCAETSSRPAPSGVRDLAPALPAVELATGERTRGP